MGVPVTDDKFWFLFEKAAFQEPRKLCPQVNGLIHALCTLWHFLAIQWGRSLITFKLDTKRQVVDDLFLFQRISFAVTILMLVPVMLSSTSL
jgi:hypothetical protein